MARLKRETAIIVSIILGVMLLSILRISGIFSMIILGFVATYLTAPSQRSYKIGGIAGIILGFLIFIYGLFISPTLPIDPPRLSNFIMMDLELSGIFILILGLIISVLICCLFGLLGGLIAQKILKKKIKETKTHVRKNNTRKSKNKAPRRTLNRTYKN